MIVGLCTVSLALPAAHSLKEKRGMLKPLIAQLRKEFNVSVAEVEEQDRWQAAGLGIAVVGSEGANLHGTLEERRPLDRADAAASLRGELGHRGAVTGHPASGPP